VTQELRDAVQELHEFLSDQTPPLLFADAMALLLELPASTVAAEIGIWVSQQQVASPSVPTSDFLYHAVRKVALMGELDLVPRGPMGSYVRELGQTVLFYCPEEDRPLLGQNFDRLAMGGGGAVIPVEVLHRQHTGAVTSGAGTALAAPPAQTPRLTPRAKLGLRRLSLFLERLQPEAAPAVRTEVASQFVTAAAVQSTSAQELEQHLAPLRDYGIETAMDQIVRTLARTLPGWGNIMAPAGAAAPPASLLGAQVNAMRQIVSLADNPADSGTRFKELVQAAIEQFNEGNLGRAVTMFELADQLVADGKVQPVIVDVLRQAHDQVHYERLRKFAERGDMRAGLRTVMNFFYALRPDGLLTALNGEERRERRHELLALLEAHEGATRALAYETLKNTVDNPSEFDAFFQMNLVYLLRVIPRPPDASVEEEVSLVTRAPGKDSPPPLIKQVIAYLGYTRHEKSERALVTCLHVFENMLLQPATSPYSLSEVETLLDRTCAALARYATPRAWRALVDHGLKTEVKLGSPTARLVEAGRQDLSSSPDLVDRMIAALRHELVPKSVVGLFMKNEDRIRWLIQALSGTPLPEVREVLEEIVDRFSRDRFSDAAAKALATLGAASRPAPAAGLSGDLELFGLPGVLQTLGQSALTGVLSLMNIQGKAEATIIMEQGLFRGAQYGGLRSAHAVYQLFERPFPGTFAFVSRPDVSGPHANSPPRDVVGVILEGMRRHDEFKRAATLVPDDAVLEPTEISFTPLPDEDPELVRIALSRLSSGATATHVESGIARDCYHVRRLLAHWVEEGSLQVKAG
jgi:hypothetical protein